MLNQINHSSKAILFLQPPYGAQSDKIRRDTDASCKKSTSSEKLTWNMNVVMAQSFVDSLRDNVVRSIEQKLLSGEWISTAPIGYLHITGGKR